MSLLDQTAVLILTFNEEPNIARTLDALSRFSEIIVLDSGSTDDTRNIIARFPNARVVTRSFDQHAAQWNYGLNNCGIGRRWILAIDADYLLPRSLVEEIAALRPADADSGYRVSFRYCICGQPLSGALYPSHVVLYRRDRAYYVQEGHTQRLTIQGRVRALHAQIDHDDRKSLTRWFASQRNYVLLEADHLLGIPRANLRYVDRVRRTGWLGPPIIFIYTFLWKRCVLDGWAGWLYTLQRTLAEIMIAMAIIDKRLRGL